MSLFEKLGFTKQLSIYEEIVFNPHSLTLENIINKVRDTFTESQTNISISDIKLATGGHPAKKRLVNHHISQFIKDNFKEITEENIDSLLKNYDINYYNNLFMTEKEFEEDYSYDFFFEPFKFIKNEILFDCKTYCDDAKERCIYTPANASYEIPIEFITRYKYFYKLILTSPSAKVYEIDNILDLDTSLMDNSKNILNLQVIAEEGEWKLTICGKRRHKNIRLKELQIKIADFLFQQIVCNPRDDDIYNYFEQFRLSENSPFEDKIKRLSTIVFQENWGLGVIDEFCDDLENINEVWANNYDDIHIQFKGVKRKIKNIKFSSFEKYDNAIKNAISFDAPVDISASEPRVLCSRATGSRVTATYPPITTNPSINIRNFDERINSLDYLEKLGSFDTNTKNILKLLFKGKPNFDILGEMGAGKTTFLRAALNEYDTNSAICTIEASDELRLSKYLKNHDIRSHLYSKTFSPSECLELALRENRDIIIQGEIRTAEEAYLDIQVKNRVGKGSGGTYHATSISNFLITRRQLLMESQKYHSAEQAENDIVESEHIIILLSYNPATGERYLVSISEICKDDKEEHKNFKDLPIIIKEKDKWVCKNRPSERLKNALFLEKIFSEQDWLQLNTILSKMR